MDNLNKKPTRQALDLKKVALKLLQEDYYTFEDYAKFCHANNLELF